MRKGLLIFTLLLSHGAHAQSQEMKFSCTRYQSKCNGKQCDEIGKGFRADREKKILKLPNVEVLEYSIMPEAAQEKMIKGDASVFAMHKYTVNYKNVQMTPTSIVFSNSTPEGMQKERITIEPASGFYSYYILHTDGSIKEVPVGDPYKAYFGWCEDRSQPVAASPSFLPQAAR